MNEYLQSAKRWGIRNPINAVQQAYNFVRTVWEPWDSDIAGGINTLIVGEVRKASARDIERYAARFPGMKELYEEGYDPDIDPRRLIEYPEGTLGREYAKLIFRDQLDPLGTLMAFGEPANLVHYGVRRAYKLHDVLHVVLGCDTSVLGEVRIVSYSLGQSRQYEEGTESSGGLSAGMALAVLFLHLAIRRPSRELRQAVDLAAEWQALGARSQPYTNYRFEDMMELPVEEVRALVMGDAANALH